MPANTAVSLAPDADYAIMKNNGKAMIFAIDMVREVAHAAGWQDVEVLCEEGFVSFDLENNKFEGTPILVKGKDFEGQKYTCPIRQDLKGTMI